MRFINRSSRRSAADSLLHSLALSIKMNILLFLPGLLFLLFSTFGAVSTAVHLAAIALVQVVLASPFLASPAAALTYFHTAFNFGREFLWEWTVNWRWLGDEAFESSALSRGLLIAHALALVLCGLKWSERDGGAFKLLTRGLKNPFVGPAPGEPSADCKSLALRRRPSSLTPSSIRSHLHRPLHLQPRRRYLCAITALPVLCLVCAPGRLPRLAHAV